MQIIVAFVSLLVAVGIAAFVATRSTLPTGEAAPKDYEACTLPQVDIASLKGNDQAHISLIIGHAYGNPRDTQQGKVAASLTGFLQTHAIKFGDVYFTGDILPSPNLEWSATTNPSHFLSIN